MKKTKFIGIAASVLLAMSSSVLSGTAFAADGDQPKYGSSRALVLAPSGDHVEDDAQPEYVDGGWVTVGSSGWGDKGTGNDANAVSDWGFEGLKGIATADVDAPLYSDDGTKIPGRTVAAKSSWAVEGAKTNRFTNERRFRISAHEWISENDAGFTDTTAGVNIKGIAFKNIKEFTNERVVVHLVPGKNYDLYKSDGTLSNRKLAGGTSWLSDKSGNETSDESSTGYYRVSTDEWIRWDDPTNIVVGFTPIF